MRDHTNGLVYADDPDYKIAEGPFEPAWQSLQSFQCPEWFRDAKLGFWAHWGPQAVPMYGDWYARNMYLEGSDQYRFHWLTYGHTSKFGFKDVCAAWKAENFDPDTMMQQYQRAGARYFVALAVHHDNFDCWDSKHHRWNSVNIGPQKDIEYRNVITHFKKVISETRLPNIRFHDLRHTVATLLLSKEINPKIVQEQLGHSSINLTLNTYSHVIKSMRGIAANALEEVVGAA